MTTLWQVGEVLLDSYRVRDIRPGGHGEVYCLEDPATRKKLAAKVYRAERGGTARGLEEFRQECRRWLDLPRHVNWLEAKRVELIRGHVTLITEYVDGPSLRELLETDALSLGRFLDVMIQVVTGLRALFRQGLFHGDLKPENILVDRFGLAKLIDLSLAFPVGGKNPSLGTAPYNLGWYSNHPDLFACGIVLSEAVFGLERLLEVVPPVLLKMFQLDVALAGVADHSLSDAASVPQSAADRFHELTREIMGQKLPAGEEAYARVERRLHEIYEHVHAESVGPGCWQETDQAARLASAGKFAEARALLEQAVRRGDGEANAWSLLGSVCLQMGDTGRAREASLAALRLDRRNSRAWLNLGGCYEHEGQRAPEQAAYLKGLEMNPRRSDLWCNLARSYLLTDQAEPGWRCLGRALMVDPEAPLAVETVRMLEADAAPSSRKILEFLNLHGQRAPAAEDFGTYNDRGVSLSAVGDYPAALAQFDQALRLNPDCFEAWYNKGDALAGLGRWPEACQCLERALALNDRRPEVWCAYADLLRVMGQAGAARRVLEDALRRGMRSGKLLCVLGLACHDLGDLPAAAQWLQQATAETPTNHEIWRNLGIVRSNQRDPEAAIACFTKALALKQNDGESLRQRGECLFLLRRYQPARLDFEAALRLEPDHAGALCNLGSVILLGGGDPQEALKHLDAALKLRPGDPTILQNRQTCLNAVRHSRVASHRRVEDFRAPPPATIKKVWQFLDGRGGRGILSAVQVRKQLEAAGLEVTMDANQRHMKVGGVVVGVESADTFAEILNEEGKGGHVNRVPDLLVAELTLAYALYEACFGERLDNPYSGRGSGMRHCLERFEEQLKKRRSAGGNPEGATA